MKTTFEICDGHRPPVELEFEEFDLQVAPEMLVTLCMSDDTVTVSVTDVRYEVFSETVDGVRRTTKTVQWVNGRTI